MTTISLHQQDRSDLLCKRFAHLASSYFDSPDEARTSEARIPLENLFRILQLYRYEAFSDPRRSGILALRSIAHEAEPLATDDSWHEKIEYALAHALTDAFGQGISKDDALSQIQASLRWLATNADAPPQAIRDRTKLFLDRLVADLG